jgi:hypothetical protein
MDVYVPLQHCHGLKQPQGCAFGFPRSGRIGSEERATSFWSTGDRWCVLLFSAALRLKSITIVHPCAAQKLQ